MVVALTPRFETLVNTVEWRHSGLWPSIKGEDPAILGGSVTRLDTKDCNAESAERGATAEGAFWRQLRNYGRWT